MTYASNVKGSSVKGTLWRKLAVLKVPVAYVAVLKVKGDSVLFFCRVQSLIRLLTLTTATRH